MEDMPADDMPVYIYRSYTRAYISYKAIFSLIFTFNAFNDNYTYKRQKLDEGQNLSL